MRLQPRVACTALRLRYDAGMTNTDIAANRPPPETIEVTERRIACDGGKLGHPRVFLTIGADDFVDCTYCDRRFALKPGTGHSH